LQRQSERHTGTQTSRQIGSQR